MGATDQDGRRAGLLVVSAIGLVALVAVLRLLSSENQRDQGSDVPHAEPREAGPSDLHAGHPEPRTPAPLEASSVDGIAGSVWITASTSRDDWVPFLGGGTLSVLCAEEGILSISVQEGRFAFAPPRAGQLKVAGLEAPGLSAVVEEGGALSRGADNVVVCSWSSPSVRLFVRERGSARELSDVSVWAVADRLGLDGFGSPAIGPTREDRAVVRAAQSPVTLSASDGGLHPEFWITHPGFAPFLYRFPAGLPASEVVIPLERERTIEVTVEGPAATDCRVCVYDVADPPPRPIGAPLRSVAAEPQLVVSELPARRLAVTLERRDADARDEVVDSVFVDLRQAPLQRVSLVASAPAPSGIGAVTFLFSGEAGSDDILSLGAEILPLSLSARGQQSRDPLTSTAGPGHARGEWGPIELRVGDYVLRVASTGQVFRFSVLAESNERHEIRLRLCRPHYFTLLDGDSGARVPLRSFRWCSPMTLAGELDLDNAIGLFEAKDLDQPLVIVAPSTRVRILAHTDGYGILSEVVDLEEDPDPVLTLHRKACLEVLPGRLDQAIDVDWLGGVRLFEDGRLLEVGPVEVVLEEGSVKGRVFFSGQGNLEIGLPPLSSYGEVGAFTMDFGATQVRQVVLADLVRASRR